MNLVTERYASILDKTQTYVIVCAPSRFWLCTLRPELLRSQWSSVVPMTEFWLFHFAPFVQQYSTSSTLGTFHDAV